MGEGAWSVKHTSHSHCGVAICPAVVLAPSSAANTSEQRDFRFLLASIFVLQVSHWANLLAATYVLRAIFYFVFIFVNSRSYKCLLFSVSKNFQCPELTCSQSITCMQRFFLYVSIYETQSVRCMHCDKCILYPK